jgi:hypothetical protein
LSLLSLNVPGIMNITVDLVPSSLSLPQLATLLALCLSKYVVFFSLNSGKVFNNWKKKCFLLRKGNINHYYIPPYFRTKNCMH